ncbi:MAG: hypothetical protein VX589_11605 [Myxococcota bacterium]|nr:hypothetical protein [Myxococcota bacterium]
MPVHYQTPVSSIWPEAAHASSRRAREFHVARLARWLNVAGAEPRFGMALASGPDARRALVDGLEAEGIRVVSAVCTPRVPVPQVVRTHSGDHFNSTVYLLDGFEANASAELLRQLTTYRDQFIRPATWVVFLVESLEVLVSLYEHAPVLMDALMYRCLVIDDMADVDERSPPATVVKGWHRHQRMDELVFATITTGGLGANYLDYTRVLHSGYGHSMSNTVIEPAAQLHALWCHGQGPTPDSGLNPALLEAVMRHDSSAHGAPGLADIMATLAGRFLPINAAPTTDGHVLAQRLRLTADGQFDQAEAHALRAVVQAFRHHATGGIELEMCIAQGYAIQDDIDGCRTALLAAEQMSRARAVPVEYLAEVLEFECRFFTLLGERAEARRCLDDFERVVISTGHPYFYARLKAAMGNFNAPIDARKARNEFLEAERTFRAHGYLARARSLGTWLET